MELVNAFCMFVHDCTMLYGDADDPTEVQLIDENGCALRTDLMRNIDYTSDMSAFQQTVIAYNQTRKFRCQVSIGGACSFCLQISTTIKEPGTVCAKPSC